MGRSSSTRRWVRRLGKTGAAGLLGAWLSALPAWADPPATPAPPAAAPAPDGLPEQLTLGVAVQWALEHNPELAAVRQQHGVAAAGVVIARTYPFNPVLENRVQQASGPFSAGITNQVPIEEILTWEVELRGQGRYRRQQASATLSRTDWEIAAQEQALATRVIRAFDTVVYRQEKLRLLEETVGLDERLLTQVQDLFDAGRLRSPDLITARTELADARSAVGPGRTVVTTARAELYRALGVVDGAFELQGTLDRPAPPWDGPTLTDAALRRRADLRARQAAEAEAEARLRLTVANRYGNPSIGPAFTYDNSRVSEVGAQVNVPLPVCNTNRGEILQQQAERARAVLEVRQTEVAVLQDVQAALARLARARAAVEVYRSTIIPELETDVAAIKRLLSRGEAGVDVLRVVDVQRKLLRARDTYLDALFDLSEAEADLVAAVGDPAVLLTPCPAPPAPEPAPEVAPPPALAPEAHILDLKSGPHPGAAEEAEADLPSMPTIQLKPCTGPERPPGAPAAPAAGMPALLPPP
jgi:cobalt-zinc-cadmium efflux system outer membrane protein